MLSESSTTDAATKQNVVPRRSAVALTGSQIQTASLTFLIGALALIPRTLGLADFYTIDEAYHWMERVRVFSLAIRNHNWASTSLAVHPGVTTLWLGMLGRSIALQHGIYEPGFAAGATYLALLRLPAAIVTSLAVVVGYLLLRRLLRPATAVLASVFWATAPFLIAHSRLLHVDALVTSMMTLCLLFLLTALVPMPNRRGLATPQFRRWPFVAAGVCGGLALLTKSPALVLLPVVGLFLFGLSPRSGWWVRLRWSLGWYIVWLGIVALVVVVAWPAMWVAPRAATTRVIEAVLLNGGQPHDGGNYFLGHIVADPGWLFYPVVVLFRSTPELLLGLLLLPLAFRGRSARRVLLPLAGFALFFVIVMSVATNKLDRYLLPIWPALTILAAAGWMALVEIVGRWTDRQGWWRRGGVHVLALASVGAVLLVNDLYYQPYYLAYFNPLLGGGATAQRVMLVGWGEGLEQVGAWLSARPDIGTGPILSWIPPTLVHFVPERVDDLGDTTVHRPSSYVVLYSRSSQKQDAPAAEAYVRQNPPLFTVKRFGIDYASVYQLPRPFAEPVEAVFGTGLHLRGVSHDLVKNTLAITPSWDIQTTQAGGVFQFLHVLSADGKRVAQVDLPLDDGLFPTWQAGQQFDRPLHLPLPAKLPAGLCRVVLGVYTPATGERFPLTRGTAIPQSDDGPNVVLLTTLNIP